MSYINEQYQEIIDHAYRLERAGLWRRAARRWLDAIDISIGDNTRDWLIQRRLYCQQQFKVVRTNSTTMNDAD